MSNRRRLPNRRPQLTEHVRAGSATYVVSIGLDPKASDPAEVQREVFIGGPKGGSEMAFVLSDAGVLISLARQYGIPTTVLAHSMSRVPSWAEEGATEPASPIGAALDLMMRVEAETV